MIRPYRLTAVVSLVLAPFVVVPGAVARAQGAVSLQGFGYPPGELSTRAQGTAGATAEIDGLSPLNPAALAIGAEGTIYMQYDPELRQITGPSGTSSTTTARFPNVGLILPFWRHWVAGLSATTFLDRTWQTQSKRLDTIATDTTTSSQIVRSEGGITDVQLGLAYAVNSRIRFGIGAHGLTGSDRIALTQQFIDTLDFRDFSESTTLNYSGMALSAGAEVDILPSLSLAVSGRMGGTLRMYTGDTLISTGRVPNHYAGSITFQGIPGTLLAFRAARDNWSAMAPLSTTNAHATDANDFSGGIESNGPRVGSFPVVIRLGARVRDLPFDVGSTSVRETSFGGGLGIPLAQNHVVFDFSALHSNRNAVNGVHESAYDFSVGLRVRP